MKETIFMVDDTELYMTFTASGLRSHYNVVTMSSGKKMFETLKSVIPALILLDVNMPEMDGFAVLEKLKLDPLYSSIPVIFLTSNADEEVEMKGFDMGAVDFITKPFSLVRLHNRIMSHINVDKLVKSRTIEYEQLYSDVLFILSSVISSRDNLTGWAINGTDRYVAALVDAMVKQGVYAYEVAKWDKDSLTVSASLYDIGKLSIPESILNKPDKLTPDEFNIIKTHPSKGVAIINKIVHLTKASKYLADAGSFAEFHHENWDGTGYPHGLVGTDIPLQGRVMAFADAYNALVSDRPHRKALSHNEAVGTIMSEASNKFDPKLASVFFSIRDKFKEISEEYNEFNDKNRLLWDGMSFPTSNNQQEITSKSKILIVDDDPIVLAALTSMLSAEYDISVAGNGASGIDIAKRIQPSLVLLDIYMPAMDGYGVLVALKNDPDTKNIPVIFLSSRGTKDDKVRGLMLGAADYITKPCNEFALRLRIGNLLKHTESQAIPDITQPNTPQPAANLIPRKHFYDILESMWHNAVVPQNRISFVIFHIENLDDYTETHGHQKGERMLGDLAKIISAKFGNSIHIARWSGVEVAVAIPNIEISDVINISKDIKASFKGNLPLYFGATTAIPSLDDNFVVNEFVLDAFMALSNAKVGVKLDGAPNMGGGQSEVVDIILALNDELKYEEMLDMLITKMMDLTNSDAGTLYMLQSGKLHFCIIQNKTKGINKTMEDTTHWAAIPVDETNIKNISAYAAVKREVVILDDVYSSDKFDFAGTKRYDKINGYRTKSMLVIPLIARNNEEQRVLGVIQLINAIDPVTKEVTAYQNTSNVQILTALSQIAANALGNILHKQEIVTLHDISMTDALTGLGNRRQFDKLLNSEWNLSAQKQQPLSFLILDIDFFKRVNDTYGHVSGDIVLKGVGAVLRETLSEMDRAARWGGEEFAIVLTNTDINDAIHVANSVRVAIENTQFTVENGEVIQVTTSVGVNSIIVQPDLEYTLTNFLSDTDAALYEAKQTGRNRVCAVR